MANVNVDVTATNVANPQTPISVGLMAVCNPDGSAISGGGGGGGGGGLTNAELRATPVPVSGTVTATGPLTNAQFTAVTGAANAAAWDGAAASATMVAILKAIHAQNVAIQAALQTIAANTTPAG